MILVIAFTKPIRSGQTTYPFLVVDFKRHKTEEIKVQLPPEEREKLYQNKLKEVYDGELWNTVVAVFKILIGVNIVIPGGFKK